MKGIRVAAASAAVIMLGGAGSAFAADLNAMPVKATPIAGPATCTNIVDFFTTACQVSAYGVRFYGTVDVGAGYQTAGTKIDPTMGSDYYLGKPSHGGLWTLAPNAMSTSNIGLQIKEGLGAGWSFVGQVEAGFQPFSMRLLDATRSLHSGIGVGLADQTAINDSSFNGQFYNDLGYMGFSNDTWGTITFFRQNSLGSDLVLAYDPQQSAAAFSTLGIIGSYAGGGDTENRRDTTAVKYRVAFANWHFGAYAQVGGYEQGNASQGAGYGNIGSDYHLGGGLFSWDFVGGYRKNAIGEGVGGISGDVNADGSPTLGSITSGVGEALSATVTNNTQLMIAAKYQIDRWKFYAGYEWIGFKAGDPTITSFIDQGGLGVGAGFPGTSVNATLFDGRQLNIAWTGFRYAWTDSLDLSGAYYHVWQNEFAPNGAPAYFTDTGTAASRVKLTGNCAADPRVSIQCAGTQNIVSLVLDWKFAPKWDTYIGTEYITADGGLNSGFLSNSQWATTGGIRFRW